MPWRRALPASLVTGLALSLADATLALTRFPARLPGVLARLRFVAELVSVVSLTTLVLTALALGPLTALVALSPRPRALAAAIPGGALGVALALALFSGSAMQRSPARPWLVALTTLGVSLAAMAAPGLYARFVAPRARSLAWPALALSAALYAGHALVLPKLYPGLHALAALGVATLCTAAFAARVSAMSARAGGSLVAATVLLGLVGGASITRKHSHRALVRQGAPFAQYPVGFISRFQKRPIAPPAAATEVRVRGPHFPIYGRDVVVVTVDALRADRLRVNGGRGRMPSLDAIAARSVVFRHAYCTTPHTSYSIASLMLGKYARSVMTLPGPQRRQETLAGWMSAAGYRTAGFFPPAVFAVDGERFADLSQRGFDFETHVVNYASAPERVIEVSRYLDARGASERVFLWVHLFEPHEPYEAHPEHPYGTGRLERYDAEASAADDAIASLHTVFSSHGRRPAWVITADHGEEFGEHGGSFHGTSVYDEQVRVPLVVEVEGFAPRVVDAPVSLVDIAPTLLAGIGAQRPARLRGNDLGPLAFDPSIRTRAFAATGSLRMVVDGPHKLIVDLADGTTELYDLQRDRAESRNLADFEPDLARSLRGVIAGWEASHARAESEGTVTQGEDDLVDLPDALQRAIQGDVSLAPEVGRMLVVGGLPVRRRAAHVLGDLRVRDAAVRDALALELGSTDTRLSREAGLSLALLSDPRGRAAARAAMDSHDPAEVRRAAMGLGRLGDHAAVPVLALWLNDAHEVDAVRDEVAALLRRLRDPRALHAWVTLLSDLRLAPSAARALGELGDPRAIGPIEASLREQVYPLTIRAELEALVALGAPGAVQRTLDALSGREPIPDAFRLLRRLREPGVLVAGAVGMSLALGPSPRIVRLTGPLSPQRFRRVYVLAESVGPRRLTLHGTNVSVELPGGEREVAVDLPSPLRAVFLRFVSDGPATLRGVFVR